MIQAVKWEIAFAYRRAFREQWFFMETDILCILNMYRALDILKPAISLYALGRGI